jgi:hypothetical protein
MVDGQLRQAATAMLQAYQNIRKTIYANDTVPAFKDMPFSVEAAYAAFQQFTTTGLTAEQLGQAARMIKTLVNRFAPGTIVDEVPEVTITL